jgi:hypothetical protein
VQTGNCQGNAANAATYNGNVGIVFGIGKWRTVRRNNACSATSRAGFQRTFRRNWSFTVAIRLFKLSKGCQVAEPYFLADPAASFANPQAFGTTGPTPLFRYFVTFLLHS